MFAKHGFQNVAERLRLGRFLLGRLAVSDVNRFSTSQRLRMAFEQLGPTFIKLGQLLASRPDLIPLDFVEEFRKLQDQVPAVPFSEMVPTLHQQFGTDLTKYFFKIDPLPVGSASMAQVHTATLTDGSEVVIKILRPHISEVVATDMGVLYQLVELIEAYIPELHPYNPKGIVDEFSKTLEMETNFVIEANNLRRFGENFKNNPSVKIPRVYLDKSSPSVLVMEALPGFPLSRASEELLNQYDREHIVEIGLKAYLQMVFRDGFFHADLHPGNIFVLSSNQIGLIDFGVVGRFNRHTQTIAANMLLALAHENYEQLAYEYVELTPYCELTAVEIFARDLRDVIAPYYGLTMKNLRLGRILMDSARVAAKHGLVLPSELLLFFKSILTIEGLGRSVAPDFDFLSFSLEFASEIAKDRLSVEKFGRDFTQFGLETTSFIALLPRQLKRLVRRLNSPHFSLRVQIVEISELRKTVERSSNLLFLGLVIGSLLVSGSLTLSLGRGPYLGTFPVVSAIFFILGSILGLVAFYNYLRK